MKIAVVGAGWAGLAAAVDLKADGHDVTVFEAAHTPGGRARRVVRPSTQDPMDNGQHILLGAYTETLDLMRRLGRDGDRLLWRVPLQWGSLDGTLSLRAPRWPAPWHAIWALLTARGLSLADRMAAARLIACIRRDPTPDAGGARAPTVAQWLVSHKQPDSLVRALWAPLCLAALNTPIATACSGLYARVLKDSLTRDAQASDLIFPRSDLSDLWPDAAAREVRMRFGTTIRSLTWGEDTVVLNGEAFDAAILAIPPGSVARLIGPYALTPAGAALVNQLRSFTFLPIATLLLKLDEPYRLPMPMMMLRERPEKGHVGQWVFDRAHMTARPQFGELTVVASVAQSLVDRDRDTVVADLTEQLRNQVPARSPLPRVTLAELFIEKKATFAAVCGLVRPGNRTPWSRLVLAGDWTDTGYPGVLEGAVRSGRQAAKLFRVRYAT